MTLMENLYMLVSLYLRMKNHLTRSPSLCFCKVKWLPLEKIDFFCLTIRDFRAGTICMLQSVSANLVFNH